MSRRRRRSSKDGRRSGSSRMLPLIIFLIVLISVMAFLMGYAVCYFSRREPQAARTGEEISEVAEKEHPSADRQEEAEEQGTAVGETSEADAEDAAAESHSGEEAAAVLAAARLRKMTREEKIYQLFLVTQEQLTGVSEVTRSGETTKRAIEKYPVGGIIYFSQNLVSRDQCRNMIAGIQSCSRIGLFIAVDEEGGTVARLGKNAAMGTTSFPDMAEIGASGDVSQAYQVGYTIGSEISELGFNLDFAPVADVNSNPANPVIGSRSFGRDAETVSAMVSSCVKGFSDSGILCTVKHFPGHGDTDTDSHYGEAQTKKTLEELRMCEFLPFQAGIQAGVPFVMVGHITAPNVIDDTVPASLSPDMITGILREELGFKGLVITDSLSMQAITDQYSSGEAAVKAIQAGGDMLLMPYNLQDAAEGIRKAVESGQIAEERLDESVRRILEVKFLYHIMD